MKKDEPQKNTTQNLKVTSLVSISESYDICSEDKMTKVIESNQEDHNENDTQLPENTLQYKPAEQSAPTKQHINFRASVPTT